MSKPFFEVFPNLQLNTDIHDLMGQTEVERVSATKRRDFLRVYLKSTRLIQKADIWIAEQEIKKQLFPDANLTVKIYEKFELSSQYNPEKLMDIYKESILEEFREYSHIQYNALKTARIEYPADNEMLITMEDTVLNRSMEGEILQILEKILVERCGFSVKLHAAYVEKETGRFKEEEEAKIRMKVDAIYSRTRGRKEEAVDSTAPAQDTEQENTQSPEAKKTDNSGKAKSEPAGGVTKSFQGGGRGEFKRGEFKKGEFRKGGNFEKGALKRSDNPDVIYGRDFEEEAMKIEELIGDMGEVTIRGKVLSVDTRDIKNEKTIITNIIIPLHYLICSGSFSPPKMWKCKCLTLWQASSPQLVITLYPFVIPAILAICGIFSKMYETLKLFPPLIPSTLCICSFGITSTCTFASGFMS